MSSVKQLDLLPENWSPHWTDLFDADPNLEETLNLEIKNAASLQLTY